MTSLIGTWIMRRGLTRAHLVESEIAEDVVVRCGKRLWPGYRGKYAPFEQNTEPNWCRVCRTKMEIVP
jgi:hypothetical protein